MVATSKLISFKFVVPSRFRLRQMATSLGTLESQAYLIEYAKAMC